MTNKTASDKSISDLGYAEALTELEAILAELESSLVDVDTLATKVGRAAKLVAHCRARLSVVRDDVDKVVAGLDADLNPVPTPQIDEQSDS